MQEGDDEEMIMMMKIIIPTFTIVTIGKKSELI
jgi:hypothetical protein